MIMKKTSGNVIILVIILFYTCLNLSAQHPDLEITQFYKLQIEKLISDETAAAFERDFERWKTYWVHSDETFKTYINFSDSSFQEVLGWNNIQEFVKNFMDENPQAEEAPNIESEISIDIFENAAWVSFIQQDAKRGKKREARLLRLIEGEWKIFGMHTTIYANPIQNRNPS
jgi:hypothetical protein